VYVEVFLALMKKISIINRMNSSPDFDALDRNSLITMLNELSMERQAIQIERDNYIEENEKLQRLVAQFQRAMFGRRSEKIDPNQLQLALEDTEQAQAEASAALEQKKGDKPDRPPRSERPAPQRNRGALPKHLPREEVVIEPKDKSCPCCGGNMHVIGEDVSEQLDVVPAQFKVKVIRRPRYGCRGCEQAVVQEPAPERPIDGGMATEALIAHVLISKYADHLPLYRQAVIYARQGVALDRSTLSQWVGRACWWLKPMHQLLSKEVLSSHKIFGDDTTVPVLDPGRGKTKTGRFWAYVRDDRPWKGELPPAIVYFYSEDRKGEHPADHLTNFSGVLQVDGYAAYKTIAKANKISDKSIILSFCWAHTRRKFFDIHKTNQSPIALEVLQRIAALYAIEDNIRGKTADERRAARQIRSKPLVNDLKNWLMEKLGEISQKTELAKAIRYAINHWDGLCVFLEDGRVEMDTNTVERGMRPQKLTAKNALFAGSDAGGRNWALIASLIETAKLNGVEPFAWLSDVLRLMVGGFPANRLPELLPWNWKLKNTKKSPDG
jgi:transposase